MASPLLQLPRELREVICLSALLESTTPLSLLTTCRQLNMESQPLVYQRPIKLPSQARLFDWIEHSRPQNLKQVRHLSIQLTDVDLSPLLVPNRPPDQSAPTASSLYENELARFDAALRSLPGLTELTVVPPRLLHSQLLRGMYLSLLALIPRLHPSLKLLIVHDDPAVLDVVSALQSLPKVVFKDSRHASGGKSSTADARGLGKAHSPSRTKSPCGGESITKVKAEGRSC